MWWLLVLLLGFVLYKLSTTNFDYWKSRGVPYVEPVPIFGNFFDVFTTRTSIGHLLRKLYNQFDSPYFGVFILNKPYLVIKDPELVRTVLVKSFSSFSDRTSVSDEKCDPLGSKILFFVKNPEWKYMRNKVSPIFSTGKLKNMFALMNAAAEDLKAYLSKHAEEESIEAREACAKYSVDVIATCAFGINARSFEHEDADFRRIARLIFGFSLSNSIRQVLYFIAPSIVKLLKLPFFDPEVTNYMRTVFWQTLEEREKANYKRNDLIDIIVNMRKQGVADQEFEFVGDRVVAQAAQFYAAGFETVSATISFTLYELALHPELQTRLRSEIKSTLRDKAEFSDDSLESMKYLHMVVSETLRKYPILPFLDRMCNEDLEVPGHSFVIKKGTPVFIPLFGLHYDEQYFPDPEKYDPERFSDENKDNIPPGVYIPFGEGPRVCIGKRFGMKGVKLGLAQVLSEFEVERSADTPVPLTYDHKSFLLTPSRGLPLKFKKIINKSA